MSITILIKRAHFKIGILQNNLHELLLHSVLKIESSTIRSLNAKEIRIGKLWITFIISNPVYSFLFICHSLVPLFAFSFNFFFFRSVHSLDIFSLLLFDTDFGNVHRNEIQDCLFVTYLPTSNKRNYSNKMIYKWGFKKWKRKPWISIKFLDQI